MHGHPWPAKANQLETFVTVETDNNGRTQNAEPYSMEYPMEYLKWSTPKSHVLVK